MKKTYLILAIITMVMAMVKYTFLFTIGVMNEVGTWMRVIFFVVDYGITFSVFALLLLLYAKIKKENANPIV